ncbi:MAG: helix-turn-helix domain-containing protein [Candidatus Polarisedimenticolia bacterium]
MPAGKHEDKDIDKKEIGARIKRLRKEAGLRQWQLAEMIGATQPAIHMYERGVLPEPRRLLELARIGDTTVEWILTGRHWENGSEDMRRVTEDVYRLAFQLKEYGPEDREILESAVRTLNNAAEALQKGRSSHEKMTVEEAARVLKEALSGSVPALSAALQAHAAIQKSLGTEMAARFRRVGQAAAPDSADADSQGSRRRPLKMRSASFEPVRGHIFRADGSFLVIQELLRDKELRAELEETLSRLSSRLESKRSRVVRMKKAQGKEANR